MREAKDVNPVGVYAGWILSVRDKGDLHDAQDAGCGVLPDFVGDLGQPINGLPNRLVLGVDLLVRNLAPALHLDDVRSEHTTRWSFLD